MADMEEVSDGELQRLAEMCFTCLSADTSAATEFNVYCPSVDAIQDLFNTYLYNITVPGILFEMLDAAEPPSVEDWMSLPSASSNYNTDWIVYFVLLLKDGHRPKVYCSSGTNGRDGMKTRMENYDNLVNLPDYVQSGLENGYHIAHKGIVFRTVLPEKTSQAEARLCVLAVEASLAYTLSAMIGRQSMTHVSPWPVEAFTYDGLCSHPAFWEVYFLVDLPLTLEERQRKHAEIKARKKASSKKSAKKFYEKLKNDPVLKAIKAGKRKIKSAMVQADETLRNEKNKMQRKRDNKRAILREGAFVCEVCGLSMSRKANLKKHVEEQHGEGHRCGFCRRVFKRKWNLDDHKRRRGH